jgi:hypothetical protein
LLPFIAEHRLSTATVREVDRCKAASLRAGRLGASQINKTLKHLTAIIDRRYRVGDDRRRQPGPGKRRWVTEPKVQPW